MAVARLRGGGAEHEHASSPLLHRRTPVNRRAVPPAEALSRSVPFHLWWLWKNWVVGRMEHDGCRVLCLKSIAVTFFIPPLF